MRSSVLLLSTVVFICGCTSSPPLVEYSREVRRPERLVPLGIVHTERTTDVVTVLENVEYALFPSAATGQAAGTSDPPTGALENIPRPQIDYTPIMQSVLTPAPECETRGAR